MHNILISIIIPIYNGEKYIKKCLESILNQTYKNIEIILVNDGSKDRTLEILKEYKDSRIIIINKENTGVYDSRNIGIENASGDYLAFVDCDDWLELNMFEEMVKKISIVKTETLIVNFYRNYDDGTQKITSKYKKIYTEKILNKKAIKKHFLPQIIKGNFLTYMWLLLIKKDVIKRLNFISEKIVFMEDFIFYIDLLLNLNSIYIYDKPLYHYFCNKNSSVNSTNNFIKNFDSIILLNKVEKNILEKNKIGNFEKIVNSIHVNEVEHICFKLFRYIKKNELSRYYYYILNNSDFQLMLKSLNLRYIPIYNWLAIKFIKNKNMDKLITFYDLKLKIFNIRTFIIKKELV